jgi:branched-chain amino acid transport system permease protein
MVRARGKKIINYANEVAVVKNSGQWIVLLAIGAILVILPYLLRWSGNVNWLMFVNITFITIIAVLGLNIITGMAGQVSLGHTAFVMVGAFATGALMQGLKWPFWGALPVSALLAAVMGLIVGAPSLRLKGFYLAVATLAFLLVAQFVIRSLQITGGIQGIIGIPSPTIGVLKINDDTEWYYLIFVFLLIFIFFSVNLTRSRLGRSMVAVRDNDTAAASLGIQAYTTKLRAFFIGSLFAGIAGSLLAAYMTVVRTDQSPFTIWDSIWYLGMIVIGGAGSTAGAILGVIFLRLISQILHIVSMADWAHFIGKNTWIYSTSGIYGLIIVLFVSFQPYGLMAVWKKIRMNYKRWPFGY